jgi:hypothetical protein
MIVRSTIASLVALTLAACGQSDDDTPPYKEGVYTALVEYEELGGNSNFFRLARQDPRKYCSAPTAEVMEYIDLAQQAVNTRLTKYEAHLSKRVTASYAREGQIIWRRVEMKGYGLNSDTLHDECFLLPA